MVDYTSDNFYNKFLTQYYAVHPNGDNTSGSALYFILADIMYEFEILCEDEIAQENVGGFFAGLDKVYLLFHDVNFGPLCAKLQSLIINRNDLNLSDTDYALLFYISLQGEEIQDITAGVPLSMLYDMFMPVAEEKIRRRPTVDG
jgi:hypothetical protein